MTTNSFSTRYTPTLMEKLLGRNYKWWFLALHKYRSMNGRTWTFLISNIARAIEYLIIIYVWKLNPQTTSQIITYLALGRVFQRIVTANYAGVLSDKISNGSLTSQLMYPRDNFWLNFGNVVGGNLIRNFIDAVISLGLCVLFFSNDILFSSNALYLIPFVVLVFFLYFCLNYLIGTVSFLVKNKGDAGNLINTIGIAMGVLSGNIIPLDKIPVNNLFLYIQPFSYLLHHPMQIYLGKYSNLEILYVFLGGIFWCFVLYFLAKLVFKIGLKKNESVGL